MYLIHSMKTVSGGRLVWIFAVLLVQVGLRCAEAFPLKDITKSVDAFERGQLDFSEFSYVSVRGASLYTAISIYLNENARDDGDKVLSKKMETAAERFWTAALFGAKASGKSKENLVEQLNQFLIIYSKEIIRTKQLNNEIFGPAVRRDFDAMTKMAPLVNTVKSTLEDQAVKNGKQ